MARVGIYVINLDRCADRLQRIGQRLSPLGLTFERIPAVDGAALGPPPWPGFDHAGYRRRCGKAANRREYACYMSHMAAYDAIIASGVEFGLVLEDDATFGPDLPEVIEAALAASSEWDVLQLGGYHWGAPHALRPLIGRYRLCAMRSRHPGAFAYLLTRAAAIRYREALLPMTVPIDIAFDQSWLLGLRFRAVKPNAAWPAEDTPSTIKPVAGEADGRKFPWWRRGSVLAFRIGNEASRIGYYLSQGLLFWPQPRRLG